MLDVSSIGVLVTDWDETVTSADTLELCLGGAYDAKPGLEPEWKYFEEEYWDGYTKLLTIDKPDERTCLEEEMIFLEHTRALELASRRLAEEKGILKEIPMSYLRKRAERVKFRTGWWELFGKMRALNVPIIIVSIHWCSEFIKEAFRLRGFDDVIVYSNSLETDDKDVCTGKIIGAELHPGGTLQTQGLAAATDKREILKIIRQDYKVAEGKLLYYFGDSTTDILALLDADAGVIVHKHGVVDRLRQLGYTVTEHKDSSHHLEAETLHGLHYIQDWTRLV